MSVTPLLLWCFTNLVATAMMTGVIWTVQVVHYPLFKDLEAAAFSASHALHSRNISFIVMPLMVLELIVSGALFFVLNPYHILTILNCAFTLIIWASTFLLSIPIHNRLSRTGKNEHDLAKLVRSNWPRSVAYSMKLIVASLIFLVAFGTAI